MRGLRTSRGSVLFAVFFVVGSVHSSWPDCSADGESRAGPLKTTSSRFTTSAGKQIYVHYPTSGDGPFPAVAFMHGMTLGYEYYARHLTHFASHGIVALFPFVKSPDADDAVFPIVTETNGASLMAAVGFAAELNANASSPLHGRIDTARLGLAGHSMGGEDVIKAAAQLPAGKVNVAISQHPSLCGPFGPPPYPNTYSKEELRTAVNRTGLVMLISADNDRAFRPGTAGVEHGCWKGGTVPGKPSIYAQFSKAACSGYPACGTLACKAKVTAVGSGHMCACDAPWVGAEWSSPELPWLTVALKLWLQFDGSTSSVCHDMLWGSGQGNRGQGTLQGSNLTSLVEFSA